jgi:[acyl-carrier-protein] S-malonyltransferase
VARTLASKTPRFLPDATDPAAAWLFPGQGAQEVGMGADLWQASAAARAVFEIADSVLGYSLSRLCFEGPEEQLRDTRYTQPAIMTVSLACLAAAVEAGTVSARPRFTAGHSLGEYSALVASGSLTLEDGLLLIRERARLMAEAGEARPGTLAAIIGLDEDAVEAVCRASDTDVCNRNLPNQTVIGGTREAVAAAIELAKSRGAQRAVELNVSGAFHSRLMRPAAVGRAAALRDVPIADPTVLVVSNVTALPLRTAAEVRTELERQIESPVRWHESVSTMCAAGVSHFIEFGPGRVLTGMVKRMAPGSALANISTLKDATQAGESAAAT